MEGEPTEWEEDAVEVLCDKEQVFCCPEQFYWPGISKDVASYVKCCIPCQKAAPALKLKQPLHPIPVNGVWDRVNDTVGNINGQLVSKLQI